MIQLLKMFHRVIRFLSYLVIIGVKYGIDPCKIVT